MKWAWCFEDTERSNGPFDSYEAALASAREVCKSYTEIGSADTYAVYVGQCVYVDPGKLIDVDWIADVLEDHAADEGGFDGGVFTLVGKPGEAQQALESWLRTWFRTRSWYMADNSERVMVSVDQRGATVQSFVSENRGSGGEE